MARRRPPEEHENHERWLVSYADFITLLFAFFVVMYSISSINEGKYKVLSESLEGVFNQPVRSIQPIAVGQLTPRATAIEDGSPAPEPRDPLQSIASDIREAFAGLIADGQLSVRGSETWLEIELSSSLLFPSGNAIPNDAAFALIERVARILAPYRNPVQVQGFTDNLPISTASYPTNWELSSARAASVVRMLAAHGVDPARLAAVGYGEFRPAASNDTAAGRARNRRVILAISRDIEVHRASSSFSPSTGEAAAGTQSAATPGIPTPVPGAANSTSL